LAELFQWRGEVPPGLPGWKEEEKLHLGEELSDCLTYLVRLADRCGINLTAALLAKWEKNAIKYPVAQVKGSSRKYNEYEQNGTSTLSSVSLSSSLSSSSSSSSYLSFPSSTSSTSSYYSSSSSSSFAFSPLSTSTVTSSSSCPLSNDNSKKRKRTSSLSEILNL